MTFLQIFGKIMQTIGVICFFLLCSFSVIQARPATKSRAKSKPAGLNSLKGTRMQSLSMMNPSQLKRGWCNMSSVEQVVKIPGCLPAKIVNNYCFGQCSSIYIPHYNSIVPAFESCTACTPVKIIWRSVTLKCPNAKKTVRKHRYRHVKRCRCRGIRLRSAGFP